MKLVVVLVRFADPSQPNNLPASLRKRVPCPNEMNRNLRTVYATVPNGFIKRVAESLYSVFTNQPLSLVAITVSPYWYIRGVTPRCRIRRW